MRIVPSISLLVFSCFYLQVYTGSVSGTDTLFQGQIMAASDQLASPGNKFELGFFSTGSTALYLAIRMKNVPTKNIVWIANRDLPLSGSSMSLTINGDGYLVIVNGRTTYRVSDDDLSSSQNVSATLLDSGNLVLRNGNSDILWQSFDYPLNTFLPGMKLGYSKKTGKVWSLTSWLDQEDPNKGDFEVKMDSTTSNAFVLMRGNKIIWSSGAWNGKIFTDMPEMRLNYIFNYTMYSNENETYFSYSLYNPSILSRCTLDISGQIRQSTWLESNQQWNMFWAQPRELSCNIFNACGPFSSCSDGEFSRSCLCLRGFYRSENQIKQGQHRGCTRRIPLTCGTGENRDRFFKMNDMRYPLSSTQEINTSNPFPSGPQVSSSDARTCEEACLNNCSCSAYAYNTSGHCLRWFGDILDLKQLSAKDTSGSTIFIRLAASEFDNGRGANNYIGIIAIPIGLLVLLPASFLVFRRRKSLKDRGEMDDTSQDILLFDVEMTITTSSSEFSDSENPGKRTRKDTAFPLFSFASVSEATENFSLENKLGEGGFGPVYKGKLLNGQELGFISFWLKQPRTTRLGHKGTYGYMSPEYAMEGLFSVKSDVFSFGVLLLEIVSGKKNTGFYHSSSLNLIGHAWTLWEGERGVELVDPKLEDQVSYPMLQRYIHVGLLCVQEMAADRPTMSEVVSMLTNELTVVNSPKKPAYSNARSRRNNSNQPCSKPATFSVNNVTVSAMDPR
ncbi:hypothetical protein V6N12_025718 [Hibiscus sabdariffa]|uniref:Receptor-like serine/threonine-protein kinase n=1 Tax=Hibiscus sabdariffa TaxID=183260 RepID=A0ABR2ATP3_9ROSI